MADISFDGRVAIVTGAGHGIGRAEALELAGRGASVVVNDLERQSADDVVAEISEGGGRAVASYDSVATAAGGRAIVERAISSFGPVDIVINNAGILRNGYFDELSIADIDAVFDTHLRGAFFVTQPAWRMMKERGYGRVVMTSSSSGMFSHHGLSNYAAAKAGLYGLTKALAYEGADHGIKVNALLPFATSGIYLSNPIPDMDEHRARFLDDADQSILAPRRDPELVAAMTGYLASDVCEPNGEAFSCCAGRYGRVFVGVADGWLTPEPAANIEAVAEHIAQIRDLSRHSVPTWLFEENKGVADRLRTSA